jgi:SAM-dependent methyltransferase
MDFDLSLLGQKLKSRIDLIEIFSCLQTEITHSLTKRHISSQIDQKLGFQIKHIEEILQTKARQIAPTNQFDQWGPSLHNGAQTWVGLDFQILQTTYHDIKILFDFIKPKPGEKVIDLGAGYGRLGIFLHHFYPQVYFEGIELVKERVEEGNRIFKKLNARNKKLNIKNLAEIIELPEGDIFFIYDFGSISHIKNILNLLKKTPKRILIVKGKIARQLMLQDEYYGEGIKIKKLEDIYLYV